MKMFEDENMDKFILEQRARIDQERQMLEKNPTSAISDYVMTNDDASKQKVS